MTYRNDLNLNYVMTLFISYGMTRSGSTLAFETEKAILEKYGMPQEKIIIGIGKLD